MASAPGDSRLRILTLNLWHRSGPWDARVQVIRRALDRLRPDLVSLQEVLRWDGVDQADQLIDGLPGWHKAYAPAAEVMPGLHLGNAVLSRFPIAETRRIALPDHGDDETRVLLGVEVETPFGRVPFFATHLNWKLQHGWIREKQVACITEQIDSLCPRGDRARFPPILAGDFNAEPLSDEIRFLYGWRALEGRSTYWADCFHVAGGPGAGPGFTYAPSKNPYAADSYEPDRRLDYLFVRGVGARGRPLHARVVCDEPEDGVFASDHFGVYAELATGA